MTEQTVSLAEDTPVSHTHSWAPGSRGGLPGLGASLKVLWDQKHPPVLLSPVSNTPLPCEEAAELKFEKHQDGRMEAAYYTEPVQTLIPAAYEDTGNRLQLGDTNGSIWNSGTLPIFMRQASRIQGRSRVRTCW